MAEPTGEPSETATNPSGSGETNRVTESAAKRHKIEDDMLLKNPYTSERREAAGATSPSQEIMRGGKVHPPTTAEVKEIKLNPGDREELESSPDEIPEAIGRENVKRMFEDANDDYDLPYEKTREMYPRVTNGNPGNPWQEGARATVSMDGQAGRRESDEMEALVPAAHE